MLGDISTGASNDLQRANSIARNMVTKYGMKAENSGRWCWTPAMRCCSLAGRGTNPPTRDHRLRRGSGRCAPFSTAHGRVHTPPGREHRRELGIVANFLLEHETMSAEEFRTVFTQPDAAKESQSTSET